MRLRNDIDTLGNDFSKFTDCNGYLDSRKVIWQLYSAINEVWYTMDLNEGICLYVRRELPIYIGSIRNLSFRWVGAYYKDLLINVDIVPILNFPNWSSTLIDLNSKLTKKFAQNIEQSIVFKTPSASFYTDWNKLFRISMSECEKEIMQGIPVEVRRGYIMLKSLTDTLYFPQVYYECYDRLVERFLTTYVLKTCFLHVLEKAITEDEEVFRKASDETSNNVSIRWAKYTLNFLRNAIRDCKLSSFFIKDVNLMLTVGKELVPDQSLWYAELFCLRSLVIIGTTYWKR